MKSKLLVFPMLHSITLFLVISPMLHAASGNLIATGTVPNWATASNWSTNPSPAPGIAAGDIVGVNSNIAATSTLNINSISRIVGTLNIGDSDNTNSFIINTTSGSGLTLTFNNSGSGASLNELGSVTDTIATNVGVILADHLAASAGGRLHINGPISETGGTKNLTKSGNGILQLANSGNSYTGVTAITGTQGGILVTANNALGTTAGSTTVAAGTSLGLVGGVNYASAETIVGSGAGTAAISGAFTAASRGFIQGLSGVNTFAGAIQVDATGVSRIGTQDGGSITLAGPITMASGTTGVSILFRAGSTNGDFITLSNSANSWDGQTQIFSGNTGTGSGIRLGSNNALSTSAPLAVVTNSTSGTRLDLAGFNQEINGLLLNTSATFLKITNSAVATTSTLTLNASVDRLFDTGGVIENGAGIVEIVKTGAGAQTLGGVHTYSGQTTVSAGRLTVGSTGSINDTSEVSIGAGEFRYNSSTALSQVLNFTTTGGTLSGIGAINQGVAVTVGNTLSVGDGGIGSMTFGSALTIDGSFIYELSGGTSAADFGQVTGNLTLGGMLDLVQLGSYTAGDKFTLFAYNGTLDGTFSGIIDDSEFTAGGGIWIMNYNDPTAGSNGGVSTSDTYVTITAVPEPTAALLAALGALSLFRRRRA
jgi:autotransporter-associated beta strand protein